MLNTNLPRTRAEALDLGFTRYWTGVPCKKGHVAPRFVSSGGCVECQRANSAAWKAANPVKARASSAAWKSANRKQRRRHLNSRDGSVK